MALDEAAMDLARAGDIVVRLYGWSPPCISLGRNQPAAARFGGRPREDLVPGVDIVRRPTGGRSVYHGPEVTYAFVAPERFRGGPRAIYAAVHGALRTALDGLGVPLDPPASGEARRERAGEGAAGPPLALDEIECFVAPAPGELVAGGRKLVGSAQWRHEGAVLQHGSVLLENEQARAAPAGGGGAGAIGLSELVDRVPAPEALRDALATALAGIADGARPVPTSPPPAVLTRARDLAGRYRGDAWTWRRGAPVSGESP